MLSLPCIFHEARAVRRASLITAVVILTFGLQFALAPAARACPLLDGLVDYNCDGKVKVVFLGDSIVKGVGDTSKAGGGYVSRLDRRFREPNLVNLGIAGITTGDLLVSVKAALRRKRIGKAKRKLLHSDTVIIDAGRNDFFSDKASMPVVRNLKKIVRMLKRELGRLGTAPFVAVSTLISTAREYQNGFITQINDLMLAASSKALPILVRPEEFDTTLLSEDGLHPTADGYDLLADIIAEDLLNSVTAAEIENRPDKDGDGVFDQFEIKMFGTDPNNPDTDSDGVNDGVEIFHSKTDPLSAANF